MRSGNHKKRQAAVSNARAVLASALIAAAAAFFAPGSARADQVNSSSTVAPTGPSSSDTKITGSFALRGAAVNEEYEQAFTFGLGADLAVDHRLTQSLTTRIDVGVNLDTGTSQSAFADEYRPVQGITLLDARLDWTPINGGLLSGGAINQRWLESPLLVGNVAFPATMISYKAKWNRVFAQFAAEGAIPTSDATYSMPTGNDPLPTADFERVTLGLDIPRTASFQAHIGHYAFSNLPSGVALESRFRGNSVTGVGATGSQFIYDFDGIETGASATVRFNNRWRAKLDGTFLTNLGAPVEQSCAALVKLETSYQLNDKVVLTPYGQWFMSESDATPAYYNTSDLAHNNRQGFGAGLRVGLPRARLDVDGSWVYAQVITPNPFQSDFNGVVFSLRKSYDFL